MSAFSEAYQKLFPSPSAREVYEVKPKTPTSDEQMADDLRKSAKQTADLAGALAARGWTVSVNIYPRTSDKGPTASVSVYRTQNLTPADGRAEHET